MPRLVVSGRLVIMSSGGDLQRQSCRHDHLRQSFAPQWHECTFVEAQRRRSRRHIST